MGEGHLIVYGLSFLKDTYTLETLAIGLFLMSQFCPISGGKVFIKLTCRRNTRKNETIVVQGPIVICTD